MELRNVRGHIEVYVSGRFVLSADTREEAEKELLLSDGLDRIE